MVSEVRQKQINSYRAKMYDKVNMDIKKGERERWKALAASCGLSLPRYLSALVDLDEQQQLLPRV